MNEKRIEELSFAMGLLAEGQIEKAKVVMRGLLAGLKEEQRAYDEWVEAQAAEERSWQVARELSSSPELLEEVPW